MDKEANIALKTYGKSFHWARLFLSKNVSASATSLYSFCRLLDDIADGLEPGGLNRLNDIDAQIKGKIPVSERKVCKFLRLADNYKIDLNVVDQLILGLIGDQKINETFFEKDLMVYCYRVAGTVGLMMAPILGAKDKQANPFAIDLGIAMQLTNISRDLLEDAALGRRYIPGDWCDGITPTEIVQIAAKPEEQTRRNELMVSIDRLLSIAENYYDSGLTGLRFLPQRNHLSIGIAAFVYRAIGEQLRNNKLEWWRGRQIVGISGKIAASARFIPQLVHRMRPPPKHNSYLHKSLKGFPGVVND